MSTVIVRKREPVVRKKGGKYLCAVCGAELPELCVKDSDPFCRTECARTFHDNPLPERGG